MKRLMFKKSKEDLENWLRDGCDGNLKHSFTFKKADNLFSDRDIWSNVPKETRKEIFDDVVGELRKKEKENRKEQRMKNIKRLAFIFENLLDITRETTWAEAQRQLAERDEYMKDRELQNMDREDALIVFQEHIFASEAEHAKEVENAEIRKKRQWRKRREDFNVYLEELHNKGIVNCMSLWSELYHLISGDPRFSAMLAQPGSTPLDLFKFYVEALKHQYMTDRKIMKEVIAEKQIIVTPDTTFDEYRAWLASEQRTANMDQTNIKMYFTALKDKIICEQSTKQAEENRKKNRLVDGFRAILKTLSPPITPETAYDDIKEKISSTTAYRALENDELAERIFANFVDELKDACVGLHAPMKKMRTEEGLQFSFRAGKRRGRGGASKKRQTKALEPVCTDDEEDENAVFES